jgi:hypothetical protein
MRTGLKKCGGERRLEFTATVERFGSRPGWKGVGQVSTILLRHICRADSGEEVTDHLWFNCGLWSEGLTVGSRLAFHARVGVYEKGYHGWRAERRGEAWSEFDYKLQRPTKVALLPTACDVGKFTDGEYAGKPE